MPMTAIEAYLNKLEARKTELKLMTAETTMLPHIKPQDRKSSLDRWVHLLNIHSEGGAKVSSPARLRLMGIRVTKREKKD